MQPYATEDFAQYEQDGYAKHQEMAERAIIATLNQLLSNALFLMLLKHWGARSACRFLEYREIMARLKSGKQWHVLSPVFLRATPFWLLDSRACPGPLAHFDLFTIFVWP